MNAAQHSVVWNNVADRLKRMAEVAKDEGARGAETSMLQLSVFAAVIASAFQDVSAEFKP